MCSYSGWSREGDLDLWQFCLPVSSSEDTPWSQGVQNTIQMSLPLTANSKMEECGPCLAYFPLYPQLCILSLAHSNSIIIMYWMNRKYQCFVVVDVG